MCGIVGYTWPDARLIKKLMSAIDHRGPDDEGTYIKPGISLGHKRLSIIDLSPKGHQPMFNEKRNIAIVFNGEIYNYQKLRNDLKAKGHQFRSASDTEVIVHGYEEYGEGICAKLEGMFVFALWDTKRKKLFMARDHIGEKPLYFHSDSRGLMFASEIKAMIADSTIKREINLQALSDYLSMRYTSGTSTMFKGISRLLPGTYATFEKGKLDIQPFYRLADSTPRITSPASTQVHELIDREVQKRLISDVPIGVFLSGGLDSSTLVAYMSRYQQNIKTFAVGFGDSTDETQYARLVADRFKTDHKEIILDKNVLEYLPSVVWHADEPLADPATVPTLLLAREVSKHVKVALSGEGGDEIFGGYQTLNELPKLKTLKHVPSFIRKGIIKPLLIGLSKMHHYPHKQIDLLAAEIAAQPTLIEMYKKLFYLPFDEETKRSLLGINGTAIDLQSPIDKIIKGTKDLVEETENYYFNEWLPNDLLMKADKMSMASSLEVRVPFLDLDLISYFRKLDYRHKHHRALFRQTVKDILPQEILERKKQGFTLPLSRWFENPDFYRRLRPHFDNLGKRGLFDKEAYMAIINNPSAFKNDHRLWVLLNLEIWCKLYLDKIPQERLMI